MRDRRHGLPVMVADQAGSTITLVMITLVLLIAAVALAIDVGKLTAARAESQRAADAGALAAASAFIDDPLNAESVAMDRAEEYAELQTIRGDTVVLVPAQDVVVDTANYRVEVTVRSIAARGNGVSTFFARVLGVNTVDIQTHAIAEAAPAGRVGCLLPIALPDMWDDQDGDDRWDWDDADRSKTVNTGDTWEPYRPCSPGAVPGTFDPPNCTGWGGPFRNGDGMGYVNDVGRPVTIKPGNPQQAMQPGWFFPWRAVGDAGGADYRDSITRCVDPESLFNGGEYIEVDIEPGNMIGPTIQGFEERIGSDTQTWTDGCTAGLSCVSPSGAAYSGPRLVHVPLFDPTTVIQSGMQAIQFTGFARMFIDDISGNDIDARWLRLGGNPGASGDGEGQMGALPLYVRLVE